MRLLLLFLLVIASSCRVNYSFTGADIPAGTKTFSVAYFEPHAPLATPQCAQTVTETLKDLLQAQTPLDQVRENGDVRYEGSITAYDVQPVAIQASETAALNRLTITVNVRYTNTLDKNKDVETTFSRFADYESTQDLTSVEEGLIADISKQLAQDIFDRTLGSW